MKWITFFSLGFQYEISYLSNIINFWIKLWDFCLTLYHHSLCGVFRSALESIGSFILISTQKHNWQKFYFSVLTCMQPYSFCCSILWYDQSPFLTSRSLVSIWALFWNCYLKVSQCPPPCLQCPFSSYIFMLLFSSLLFIYLSYHFFMRSSHLFSVSINCPNIVILTERTEEGGICIEVMHTWLGSTPGTAFYQLNGLRKITVSCFHLF